MTLGQVFRMDTATLSILSTEDEHRISVTIPVGAFVTVINGNINGNRFVDVEWENKTVTVFAADLRNRGTKVASTATAQRTPTQP